MRNVILFWAICVTLLIPVVAEADVFKGAQAFETGDYNEAFKEWSNAALNEKNIEAQYRLGMLYMVKQWPLADDAEAFKWLLRAAKKGHNLARNAVSAMYADGIGVQQDSAASRRWSAAVRAGPNVDAPVAKKPLSSKEMSRFQEDSGPAVEHSAGGGISAQHGTVRLTRAELLSIRKAKSQELNKRHDAFACWVVDAHSTCIIWFQQMKDGEYITWSGPCDANGFASGNGTLEFKTSEDDTPIRFVGKMREGKTAQGDYEMLPAD